MRHVSEDDLLLYALGMMRGETALAAIEEHLLCCNACLDRLEEIDARIADAKKDDSPA